MLHTFRTLTGPIRKAGYFFAGSVKEGTIYKGKVGTSKLEVFSPGGADGRSIATGMFFADNRLAVAGRQTGLIFVYDTRGGHLISKLDNGLRTGQLPVVPFWVTEIELDPK